MARMGPAGSKVRKEDKPLLEVVAAALGIAKLRVVETGGNAYQAEREQWDDGNNVVAMSPGVSWPMTATPTRTLCSGRQESRS